MSPFVKPFNVSSPLIFDGEDVRAVETLYGEKTGDVAVAAAGGLRRCRTCFYQRVPCRNQEREEFMFGSLR